MKVGISRFIVVAAITALVLLGMSTPLFAQISFTDFSDPSSLQLNGAAATFSHGDSSDSHVLRLSPAVAPCNIDECGTSPAAHVAGSAFFNVQQPIAGGFTSEFKFRISAKEGGNCCADGFAFVIQNQPFNSDAPSGGAYALGGSGGALGYGQAGAGDTGSGIPNSLAIEFDTWTNAWDTDNHHVAVQSCGTGPNNQFHFDVDSNFNPVPPSTQPVAFATCKLGLASLAIPNLSDGNSHIVDVGYTPGTLTISVDSTVVLTVAVDLSTKLSLTDGKAYVGFTASNGANTEDHDILSWSFTPQQFQTMTISHDTPANTTTPFDFGPFNFKSTPTTPNTNHLDITARPIPPGTMFTFQGGGTAQCIVYKNTSGTCWEFDVKCTGPDCNGAYNAEFATSYDSDVTIVGAAFGKGEPDCAGATTYTNQITAFTQNRLDPTTKGRSGGTGSCWAAVQNLTYPNTDLSIVKAAPPLVKKGTTLTYGIAVFNLGPNLATGVSVTDPIPLPGSMSLVSSAVCITGTSGVSCTTDHSVIPPCTVTSNVVTCQVGNLLPFSLRTLAAAGIQLTFQLTPNNLASGTVISNTATVQAINTDPRPNNNNSTAKTKVCTNIVGLKCVQ